VGKVRLEGTYKMITKFRVGAAGVALISAFGLASAANAANPAEATATAVIVDALDLQNDSGLNFGEIAAVSTSGTVTVDPSAAGDPASCSTVVCAPFTASAAGFTILQYVQDSLVNVYLPTTDVTLTNTTGTGGETMIANAFTDDVSGVVDTASGDTFNVGATLTVGADQVPGTYEGTFEVSVAYD